MKRFVLVAGSDRYVNLDHVLFIAPNSGEGSDKYQSRLYMSYGKNIESTLTVEQLAAALNQE